MASRGGTVMLLTIAVGRFGETPVSMPIFMIFLICRQSSLVLRESFKHSGPPCAMSRILFVPRTGVVV